ncbi:MAG: hypothetical protein ACLPN6_03510 [Streptosporangiaceae bacterium]
MTDDPITAAARAAAAQLAPEYGPGLAADVEAALHSQETTQRPSQYLDPISLGSLIVAIATLAWTVYSDLRKNTPEPSTRVVARRVRTELREHSSTSEPEADRIIEIVVTEIAQTPKDSR